MAACAFLGLGVMGFPMAGHLRAAGHDVRVWNRSPQRAKEWEDRYGAGAYPTAWQAAHGADFVMICVGEDKDVYEVTEVIPESLNSGAVVIDHTTASPACARKVAATLAGDHGIEFIDAPISGGQSGAEKGALSIMCGAFPDIFERARPVLEAYGKTITHVGDIGAGQTAKCVNQICIAGTLQGLSEGLLFAEAAGLDIDALLSAIGGGAAQSWQMDNRLKTMAVREFDFGFAIDWMRKDLGIALKEAGNMGVDLPMTEEVDRRYSEVQAKGGNRQDTSSLIRSYEED